MREMIGACLHNALKFHFLLMDSWFSAQENFEYITDKGKHFIAALKGNRLVAVSEDDRRGKRFVAVEELEFPEHGVLQGWLKGYAKETRLVRQVFTNKDGSTGILHLVCSDITCNYDATTMSYKKRWQVGGLSQEPEIQRRSGEVPNTNAAHAKQPHLHGHLRGLQARMLEPQNQAQPHGTARQVADQCDTQCF